MLPDQYKGDFSTIKAIQVKKHLHVSVSLQSAHPTRYYRQPHLSRACSIELGRKAIQNVCIFLLESASQHTSVYLNNLIICD